MTLFRHDDPVPDFDRVSREDQQTILVGSLVFLIVVVALLGLLLWPFAASSQTLITCPSSSRMAAISYASASITSNASTSLTVPTNALVAVLIATPNIVNMRDDLVAPAANSGMPIVPGVPVPICVGSLSSIQFTTFTGSTSTIHVMFYR